MAKDGSSFLMHGHSRVISQGKKGRIVWEKAKERHPPSKVTGHQGHRCQDLVKERQSCHCCVKRALQQMNDKEFQRST
ncbi:hypothetical protein D4764_11G0005330 [Takifugu flavidus]|uniref:Uncharacterized protein n=1 Tax=Takifugu flavidus TaxID=433684 RepID=A0A5C6PFB6_9TELE|nr:hypothetical protein D4764_11G0005330 [Takifugu flavidus]